MRKSFLSAAACLVLALHTGAAEQTIKPEDTVKLTLAHSRRLKIAGHDVAAMQAQRDQAASSRLPSVGLRAGAAKYSGLEDAELGPGVVIPGIEDRYFWSAEASQLLYAGGRVSASVRAAELAAASADSSRSALEADLRLQAVTAHWTWAKTHWALGSAETSVARMEAHIADVRNLQAAGSATENDIVAADAGLAKAKLRLEDARRDLNIAMARLAYLTGEELPDRAVPAKPDLLQIADIPEKDLLSTALDNRHEIAAARLAAESSDSLTEAARAASLPEVALVARYEQANPNSLFFPPEEKLNDDVFVGLNLRWNIFDGGLNRARAGEALARAEAAHEMSAERGETVALEVRESLIRLKAALARCSAARTAEESALRDLLATVTMWKNGAARQSELIDADSRYTDAQFETAASDADAAQARSALDRAMGLSKD